jgi:hypothetical protein
MADNLITLPPSCADSGFGGLVVSMLASGSNQAEAVWRKNEQHAFLRRGSKAVCPMSQICGM